MEDKDVPVTLKDIAKELNISTNAVSRALRNMPDIGPETTRQVHDMAQKMGYRKNLAASYLKTARSMTLGIMVPDICNPFFSQVYKGVEKVCTQKGYTIILSHTSRNPDKELARLESMISRGVDGIFIIPHMHNYSLDEKSNNPGIPYVWMLSMPMEKPATFVHCDDFEAGRLTAKHLYELGHRKYLLIFPPCNDISTSKERQAGFMSYIEEMGVPKSNVTLIECTGTRTDAYHVMREWLEHQPDSENLSASAISCYSDYMACGVYSALLEYGYRIPEDISVMGYDNTEYSDIMFPALTTIDLLPYDVGKHAARLMLDILQQESEEETTNPTQIVLTPKLVLRDSTRKTDTPKD